MSAKKKAPSFSVCLAQAHEPRHLWVCSQYFTSSQSQYVFFHLPLHCLWCWDQLHGQEGSSLCGPLFLHYSTSPGAAVSSDGQIETKFTFTATNTGRLHDTRHKISRRTHSAFSILIRLPKLRIVHVNRLQNCVIEEATSSLWWKVSIFVACIYLLYC